MATGDLNGAGGDDVAIDLGATGLLVLYDNAGPWRRVHRSGSEGLTTGDLDGDGKDELVADRGDRGLWARFADLTWAQLAAEDPLAVLAVDLDRSGRADLVADFGAGLRVRYDNSGAWLELAPWSVESMTAGGFD